MIKRVLSSVPCLCAPAGELFSLSLSLSHSLLALPNFINILRVRSGRSLLWTSGAVNKSSLPPSLPPSTATAKLHFFSEHQKQLFESYFCQQQEVLPWRIISQNRVSYAIFWGEAVCDSDDGQYLQIQLSISAHFKHSWKNFLWLFKSFFLLNLELPPLLVLFVFFFFLRKKKKPVSLLSDR